MKRRGLSLVVVSAAFVGMTMASVGGQQAQPVAAGVYTAAQAQAGQAAYAQQCAGCHSADFRGSGDAPAVVGPDFIAKWGPREVNELFTFLVQTMPPTNPGALGEAGTLNVTAYLLQVNGAPAGQQPLTATVSTPMNALVTGQPACAAARAGARRARRNAARAGRRHRLRPGSGWGIGKSRRDRSRRGEELRPGHLRHAQEPAARRLADVPRQLSRPQLHAR